MKPSFSPRFLLALLSSMAPHAMAEAPAPLPAAGSLPAEPAQTEEAAAVEQPAEQAAATPSLSALDPAVKDFATTLATTTLMLAADLADEAKMGDPFITAITYGQVLHILLTEEALASLPAEYQHYFETLLEIELTVVEDLLALDSENPALIREICAKAEEHKKQLVDVYPTAAFIFNDLNHFIGMMIEEYQLSSAIEEYRATNEDLHKLAPEKATGSIFRFMASYLNAGAMIEADKDNATAAEEAGTTITPDEIISDPNIAQMPALSSLDPSIQQLIANIASMALSVAADFSDQSMMGDPVIKAATYGSVLQALLTEEYLSTLPQEYQAYFKAALAIELQMMESISQIDTENPSLVQALIEKRAADKALLTTDYPNAALIFNDMHLLIAAVMHQYHMMDAITQFRKDHLELLKMPPQEATAEIFRFMSDLLTGGLRDFRPSQAPQ